MVATTLGEEPNGQPITRDLLTQFEIAKVFDDNTAPITSIDFHASGDVCVTASADDSLRLYDAVNGTSKHFVWSKKYGCAHARFTHSRSSIIYASTKEDDTIRYHSLHENKYLRYFRGHTDRVVDLEMSPNSDSFLSASQDGSVRLWDLRVATCQGLAASQGRGRPSVAFDQVAKVFAVALGTKIRLYDMANYDAGPFSTLDISLPRLPSTSHYSQAPQLLPPPPIIAIEFGNNGKDILVSTAGDLCYLVDSYATPPQTHPVRVELKGHRNSTNMDLTAAITPDAKFAAVGSDDHMIYIWDTEKGSRAAALPGHHELPTVVKWNPRYMMFASAGNTQLVFWTPPPIDPTGPVRSGS
ncbi:WD repeat-containing protein 82 [Thoreauomyces humboldtii]|nr:WD repeat-containing protein 82 [Thoreauomyces humboldtii]